MSWLYIVSSVSWRATPRTVMFLRTKRRVVVGYGLSEEFKVNIGLRQGNDPLLFIMVVALISRKFSKKDVLRKGMYANDLAMIADKNKNYRSVGGMEGVFKKEGPIMSREKTEEMWV